MESFPFSIFKKKYGKKRRAMIVLNSHFRRKSANSVRGFDTILEWAIGANHLQCTNSFSQFPAPVNTQSIIFAQKYLAIKIYIFGVFIFWTRLRPSKYKLALNWICTEKMNVLKYNCQIASSFATSQQCYFCLNVYLSAGLCWVHWARSRWRGPDSVFV